MCIGLPMQVLETGTGYSICSWGGERRRIDTRLVDAHRPGEWLLVFIDTAREVISEERARLVSNALLAIEQASRGITDIDHLFPDLVGREPQLPDFLRSTPTNSEES
ncbi:MAG: HypC/HybG/HupF family hydrogenase formation chaperone [Gammaproteobacteria bacterium]|nr:HypC/HybG/HupF family hydrogenase formation chaperone [Gammaproteobacteria bacterium]MDH4255312.1 HypC/HybG/HupF family hydrogenase formation chaperone [Gammaproteobacteria bacterium]MDH5273117.1 HypC/HybG/HupF family hydrogenase formation chaperone [Gammaproteobacteria bacterium]